MVGNCAKVVAQAWVRLEGFKKLIKDHFYLMSLQKAKENELMKLKHEGMSVLEYASKFIKLFCFALTFIAD